MLMLGGTRRLYGAFLGAVVYVVVQDYAAKINPYLLDVHHRRPADGDRAVPGGRSDRAWSDSAGNFLKRLFARRKTP